MFNLETLAYFSRFTDKCRVFAFRSFSRKLKARAMKHGSCIQLEQVRVTQHSVLSLDLLFTVH